jgi:hypothetical protein
MLQSLDVPLAQEVFINPKRPNPIVSPATPAPLRVTLVLCNAKIVRLIKSNQIPMHHNVIPSKMVVIVPIPQRKCLALLVKQDMVVTLAKIAKLGNFKKIQVKQHAWNAICR